MPERLTTVEPPNTSFYGLIHGWGVRHATPSGIDQLCLWTDATCPEMTPGEMHYRAVKHAATLISDGSLYADQVTVLNFSGGLGTFRHTGADAIWGLLDAFGPEQDEPGYWEEMRELFADCLG